MQRVLTEKEASEVLSILKNSLKKSFESVTLTFGLLYRREADKFKACCGLVLALSEETLLDAHQRLFALYALLELHQHRPPSHHPFWEFLISWATTIRTPPEEIKLIHLFLVQKRGTELSKTFLDQYVTSVLQIPSEVIQSHLSDLQRLKNMTVVEDRGIGAMERSGLHRILIDKESWKETSSKEHQTELLKSFAETLTFGGFEPTTIRPPPPIESNFEGEIQWLTMTPQPSLMWDLDRKEFSETDLQRFKTILEEAILSPLTSQQQKQILQDLEEDSKIIFRCDLDPESFPALVDHAPEAASVILRHLIPTPSGTLFLESLASMNLSLHSMEVVNSLATSNDLPSDFIQIYISNGIIFCDAIEDRFLQTRLVRLLCVFLQNLIKMGIVDITNLIHEIQAFCIHHCKIREASGLFRMLKQMENEDDQGPSSST